MCKGSDETPRTRLVREGTGRCPFALRQANARLSDAIPSVDKLPREGFGERPACPPSAVLLRRTGWHCREGSGGPKSGSKRRALQTLRAVQLRLCLAVPKVPL